MIILSQVRSVQLRKENMADAESKEVLEKLNTSLRESYINIIKYVYTKDEIQQSQYDDSINEIFHNIELNISIIESYILPSLAANDEKKKIEFQLFKSIERYHDLHSIYRSKKVNEKIKYLESLYLKSFDKSELEIINSNESNEFNHSIDYNLEDNIKNTYGSIDDNQLEELSSQEKMLQQNNILTDKLQNVNALMKSTLLAGEINLSELQNSTNTLSDLSDSYAFFGNVLNKTNTLVKSINKASKNERVMIYRSLYFFISVCCWILWRRIFKRPILLILWLILSPLKFILWSSSSTKKEIYSSVSESINLSPTTNTAFYSSITNTIQDSLSIDATTITSSIIETTTAIIDQILDKDEL